jgi:hypothetical protein
MRDQIVTITRYSESSLVARFYPNESVLVLWLFDVERVEPMRSVTLTTPYLSAWLPETSA